MGKFIPAKLFSALVLLCLILFAGTAGYMAIEKWSFFDSFYMTIITLTTVGFGEIHPLSGNGRIFTVCILLSGFGVLTYTITSGISFLMEGELDHIIRRRKMDKQLKNAKAHYIICAKAETGEYVIEEFIKTQKPVVVVTRHKELADKLKDQNIPILLDNPGEDHVLEKAGIKDAQGLITVLDEDKDNLFVVLSARGLNSKCKIIAQAINKNTVVKLKKAGADEVILTDAIGGMRMASAMLRPAVVSFLDTMLRDSSQALRVEEIAVSEQSNFKNKTIAQSNIKKETGLMIIAVKDKLSDRYINNPDSNYVINSGDILIVIGTPEQINKFNYLEGIV
jgi:voltage-gated potassium channel